MSNTFTEPTWATIQEVMQEETSRFAKEPASPFDLTGVFVRLLQFIFSNANNINNQQLKSLIWDTDKTLTNILIAPSFNRDIGTESKKPALFIERGPITPVSIPAPLKDMNIQIWTRQVGAPTAELTNNNKKFKFIKGVHNIICEGLSPAQSELLAEEIFTRFMYFSSVIEDDFSLDSFDVVGMSALEQREKRPSPTDVVSVSFSWQKIYFWETATETPV